MPCLGLTLAKICNISVLGLVGQCLGLSLRLGLEPQVPRINYGHGLHATKLTMCDQTPLWYWSARNCSDCNSIFLPTVFFQRLLLLVSFNCDISFNMFKSWITATFVRQSCLQMLAETHCSQPLCGPQMLRS